MEKKERRRQEVEVRKELRFKLAGKIRRRSRRIRKKEGT